MERIPREKMGGGGKRQEQSASKRTEGMQWTGEEDDGVEDKTNGSVGYFVRATHLCALVPSAAYWVRARRYAEAM